MSVSKSPCQTRLPFGQALAGDMRKYDKGTGVCNPSPPLIPPDKLKSGSTPITLQMTLRQVYDSLESRTRRRRPRRCIRGGNRLLQTTWSQPSTVDIWTKTKHSIVSASCISNGKRHREGVTLGCSRGAERNAPAGAGHANAPFGTLSIVGDIALLLSTLPRALNDPRSSCSAVSPTEYTA